MLHVGELAISLDRKEPGSNVDFVSHAHTDHIAAAKRSNSVLASSATVNLIKGAYGYDVGGCTYLSSERRPKFKLTDSGHILGSKQLVVDSEDTGERIVYTGDFQVQRCRVAKPIEVRECDRIIIDSTYPHPELRFDDRSEVEHAIQKWTKKKMDYGMVLFGAYALGKAEELIAILNEAGITPFVTSKIASVSEVYKKCGIKLDYIDGDQDEAREGIRHENFVGVTEKPLDLEAQSLSLFYGRKVYTAVATGFAKSYIFKTDVQFPLSDHADFSQSLDYINACGAKKVLTYGKQGPEFAENLRKAGVDAEPFGSPNGQKRI